MVPITDRGFLYGDGLFETIRVRGGSPVWWERHLERFEHGAGFLRIPLPWPASQLRGLAGQLIERNTLPDSVLRITLSRGSGTRGYSPRNATNPTLAMTLHPLPPLRTSIRLITSSAQVPANEPLSAHKTANKLVQILARAEADERGVDEALLRNTDGNVAESSASNVFWLRDGLVCTAPVTAGALAGVARGVLLELCRNQNVATREEVITPAALSDCDGVFLTNSVSGIVPAVELDGRTLHESPFTNELRGWLEAAMVG